ncbi:MAG: hypothetical protein N2560_09345 [Ignavibacteria bacterium]|nr:hypothetical protein [Ignavibacteria bacterium]
MNSILSIFFSPERTYLALLEMTSNGLNLKNIGTTTDPIDLENIDNPSNEIPLKELYGLLNDFVEFTNIISVSIPMEYVILTQFPGRPNISTNEILSVINIEIRQQYPQFNTEEFPTHLFELMPRKEHTYYLAAIIPKKIFQGIKTIANKVGKIVERIEISQISAHNSLLYNYPEEKSKIVGIFNISDKFIDYSIVRNQDFFAYNLIKYNSQEQIPNLIQQNFEKIAKELNITIDSLFFFGSHLNKVLLEKISLQLKNKVEKIQRLNPFRLVTSELDAPTKQLCARIAHHFAPCVGSILPEFHKRIKIY